MKNNTLQRLLSGILSILLVLSLLPPVQIFADGPVTVYLDAVNGSDTNDGLTEAAPVQTLEAAYTQLTAAGGTLVLLSDVTYTASKVFPSCDYPVTITSATGAEGFVSSANLQMGGDTTFENITFTLTKASGATYVSAEGHNLTLGEGITNVACDGYHFCLTAGGRYSAKTGDVTLTVKSGTWRSLYGVHGYNLTGDLTLDLQGGTLRYVAAGYNGQVSGNVTMNITGTTIASMASNNSHANGQVGGNVVINLGDNADIGYISESTGTVVGTTTINVVGDCAAIESITGGTALNLQYGRFAAAVTDVDTVAIDVPAEKTLTLAGAVTADTVVCAGTLNFEGTGSLTATAVTGTVNCTITGEVLTNKAFVTAPADADIVFPAESNVVAENGKWMVLDKENFKGLVIKAESDVTMVFYKDHTRDAEDKIQPDYQETVAGYTYYYFAGVTGYYCYDAKRSGDYTIYQRVYVTEEECAAGYVEEVVMEKKANASKAEWDHTYYYGQVDEFVEKSEENMDEKWHTDVELVTPVFTNPDKPAHQMTTQPELHAFIDGLNDDKDNMYVFSIGKSGTHGFDIPIVFFTKTDLSQCETLEDVAAALKADGLPNIGYKAQMHGDEHAAGEGALNVIYQLDKEENNYLLDTINIYVMPRLNPDGAYECRRNLRTASMLYEGFDGNTDPNRHNLTLAYHEVRLYMNTVRLFDPVAELDGHERQRSSNVADNQISTSWRYGSSQDMLDLQVELVESMFTALDAVDLSGSWYTDRVNCVPGNNTRSYAAAQSRIHLLMETRGIYLGNECYGSRTASHIVSAMAYLKFCAENVDEMIAVSNSQRETLVTNGKTYEETDTVILNSQPVAHPEFNHITEKFNFGNGKISSAFTQEADIMEPTATRVMPTAYVIPKGFAREAEILELMGLQEIAYYALPANTAISLQQYSGTVGTDKVTTNVTLSGEQIFTFPEGCYVFQMDQVNSYVLALLMEPDNAAYDLVEQGRIPANDDGTLPIYRYIKNLTEDEIGIAYTVASAAPTGIIATDATSAANDGVISGLDADKLYEYKAAGADEYTKVAAGSTQITGLAPNTYYVRFQADESGTVSMETECTIGCSATVYVSAASGSDTNTGTEETAALATLDAAYAKLSSIFGASGDASNGKIILVDDYTISSDARVDLPSHTYPVSIEGKNQSVKLIFSPTVISEATQALAFHGPTTLDNMTFHATSTGKYDYVYACGNKMVIGENFVSTSTRTNFPYLVAGGYKSSAGDLAEDTDLTVKGGTWNAVYAGNFYGGHSGTAKLTVTGGTIKNGVIRTNYSGAVTGDYDVYLSGLELTYYCGTFYSGSISGDVKLTLGEGFSGTVYTGARRSGNVTGTVTIVADGVDMTNVTLVNAPGADNTSGTVTKGVLSYASGTAIAVEGMDETHIDTSSGSKVTLGSDITVHKVIGGGSLELNGYDVTAENVTVEGNIAVSDNATDDYDVADENYGILTGIQGAKPAAGYVMLTTTEGTSFHKAALDIGAAVIRPREAGVYYIGSFQYDDLLAENITQFGIAVSLYDTQPVVDDADEGSSLYTTGATSALIVDILDSSRTAQENAETADMKIYARAYVIVNGEIYYGDTVAFSLKTLIWNADKYLWDQLTDVQKAGLTQLYADFSDVMSGWKLTNIK